MLECGPNPGSQLLERGKSSFVRHLLAVGDPIAEIDVRLSLPPALLDKPENTPGSEAALGLLRIVKAVNRRDAVIEEIDQRGCDEVTGSVAEFRDGAPHRRIFKHPAVIAIGHRRHIAVAVARTLILREQAELLGRSASRKQATRDAEIGVADAPSGAGMAEVVDGDAHRHAGGTTAAGRPVGKAMAAAEPGARQIVVKQSGAVADEFDDQLAFGAARHIRAGHRGGGEELSKRRSRACGSRSNVRLTSAPLAFLSIFGIRP